MSTPNAGVTPNNPFMVGDEVWFSPQSIGYGYDYGSEPRGIPATIMLVFETRCTIRFRTKDTLEVLQRVVAVNNLCPRIQESTRHVR